MGDKGSSGAVRIGPRRARSRRASFGVVAVAYALALVAGVVSGAVDDSSPYLAVAAGMFAGTVVIFVFSRCARVRRGGVGAWHRWRARAGGRPTSG